jgi:hypothetical protein
LKQGLTAVIKILKKVIKKPIVKSVSWEYADGSAFIALDLFSNT